jgi:hypothetical protein
MISMPEVVTALISCWTYNLDDDFAKKGRQRRRKHVPMLSMHGPETVLPWVHVAPRANPGSYLRYLL